jgi:hypothetical protein
MKLKRLENIIFIVLIIVLTFVACDLLEGPKDTFTGTVTITRLGNSWIPDHSRYFDNMDLQTTYENSEPIPRMSPPPPPYDRPRIYAYTDPNGKDGIGSNDAEYPKNDADFEQGKYPFEIEILSRYLPCFVYFYIEVPMTGFYPSKITERIWIEKNGSNIDLGVIDFNVIRLTGNLPVTFNGQPSTAGGYSRTERRPMIHITKRDGSYIGSPYISPGGEWVQYFYSQDSQIPINFILEAREKGGVFSNDLDPGNSIMIHNTDKDIVFPDYPGIDFQGFILSGTIDLLNFYENNRWYLNIEFFDEERVLGVVDMVHWQFEKNDDGQVKWATMIPVFIFPKNLSFRVNYETYSSIVITEDTCLDNIHLGSFTF